jgi:hypothetical protein
MNARTLELTIQPTDEASLFEHARHGDLEACAALLDDIAPDVYGDVLLEVRDAREAQRITDGALIAVAKRLRRGEIANARELRWQLLARAREDGSASAHRQGQIAGVRSGIRHLFGLVAVSGLAVYATVLAL